MIISWWFRDPADPNQFYVIHQNTTSRTGSYGWVDSVGRPNAADKLSPFFNDDEMNYTYRSVINSSRLEFVRVSSSFVDAATTMLEDLADLIRAECAS